MIEAAAITTTGAAFVAGLVTSVHCVAMCGPLACAFGGRPGDSAGQRYGSLAAYHIARIFSYGCIGALAGAIGRAPMALFHGSSAHYLPWVLVAFFLLTALGVEKHIPKPKFFSRLLLRIRSRTYQMPRTASASLLGFATPLMPCGPLYFVFGVALTTGSALRGFEFLVAFALGTLPLLGAAHAGLIGFGQRLNPVWMSRGQRALALAVAVIFALRMSVDMGPGAVAAPGDPATSPAPASAETQPAAAETPAPEIACPFCH